MNILLRTIAILLSIFILLPSTALPLTPELTPEEKKWLMEHDGKIVLAPEIHYPPLQYLDDSGEFKGITEDYLRVMEKRLNFHFKRITVTSWNRMLEMARNREIDVIAVIMDTPERREYFNFTSPYITVHTMIITHRDYGDINSMADLSGKKVAVTRGYQINDYLDAHFPSLYRIPVNDEEAALTMVSEKKADAALVELDVASYYIEKHNIKSLRVAGKTGHAYHFSIGVRNDWPVLVSIMEKGLATIGPEERQDIYKKWIRLDISGSSDEWKSVKYPAIIFLVIAVLVLGIFFLSRLIKRTLHSTESRHISSSADSIGKFLSREYLFLTVPFIVSIAILAFLLIAGFYYFFNKPAPDSILTPEEQRWLQENDGKIRLSPHASWPPMEFFNNNEEYDGYIADIIKRIEKDFNFSFKIVKYRKWSEIIDAARKGDIDVISSISYSVERSSYLLFTTPFATIQNVILVRKNLTGDYKPDDLRGKSVGVVKNHILEKYTKDKYPYLNIQTVSGTVDGLHKLSFGELDAFITDLPSTIWFTEKESLTNIRVGGYTGFDLNISMASRKDMPLLHHILQKGLDNISAEERDQLSGKWFGITSGSTHEDDFWLPIIIVSGTFLFIILVILQWNRSLRKLVDLRSKDLANELTERYRAEQEALIQSDLNRIFIQATPLFYVALDVAGNIMMINEATLKSLGYKEEEVIGRNFIELFIAGDEREEAFTVHRELTGRPSVFREQFHIISHSGRIIPVEWYSRSLFRPDGSFEMVFSMGTDMTEKKRTEEMMIQTEKMMTVAGLAAGMAHEINNPLGIIMLAAESIKRRFDRENAQNIAAAESLKLDLEQMRGYMEKREIFKYLASIQNAGSRAAKIVSNMLQFSRTAGTERTSTDINHLIDDTIELVSSDYDMKKNYDFKHITIKKEYDMALSRVMCIKNEIEQVIFNILRNAAHALNEIEDENFHPQITIGTMEQAGRAVITITDNGPGMEEQVRHRIFEPFYTTKPVGDGTGLGLSVSFFIITQNHNGNLSVSSSPGHGATFTISLPFQ